MPLLTILSRDLSGTMTLTNRRTFGMLFAEMDAQSLATTYLRHFETKNEQDWWSVVEVDRLVRDDPYSGSEVTRTLVNEAKSDEALAYVAAGPLEDLLKKHGPVVIDLVEGESRNNDRLQLALSGVWGINPGNPIYDRWYALMWK